MDITIDKRKTDIIYVDKANNHVAYNKEVIKLINNCNSSIIDVYVNILAGFNNLNDTESKVIKYIICNIEKNYYNYVLNAVAKNINKSTTTISRAIKSLINKKLIYINSANKIILSNAIAIDKDTIDNSKFLIIEINPKVTSKEITI